ncbi:MAG TPA: carboxypeptidase regulatory-like domain-containing protein, partial [Terriglobia bacterium]|nr:carboxypeptidase regulatory-like domain-containing protein [Terriglobia bacterium]
MLLRSLLAAALLAGSLSPGYAQSRNGTIVGAVLDSQTGHPIPGAEVAVSGTASAQATTDLQGLYRIAVPPGTYVVAVRSAGYHGVELTEVMVEAGKTVEASTVLVSLAAVTSIDVVESASAVGATAQAMLIEQKLAPVISDSLSREELSASTAGDAAGALEKVTGVSVVGDGYVYVRGLGERYSAAQMNGAVITTTEPEKRVVPLDLFPSSLIENLRISKTYSPDLPAEFSGGLVEMKTIEFPAQPILNLSVKSGFNTATTFGQFLSYPGGAHDFFGFDDGSRNLPSLIPGEQRLFQGAFTPAELQQFGRAFSVNWEPTPIQSIRPAVAWSAVAGGTFGRFGLVGALTFDNTPHLQEEVQRYIRQGANAPVIYSEYKDFRTYTQQAKLGAVFNASVQLRPNHQILFRNTLTRDGEKSVREFSGYDGGIDSEVFSQRLRWVERKNYIASIEGNHSFPALGNGLVHWQFTRSLSTRKEPDLREVIRGKLPDGQYIFVSLGSSAVRYFGELEDRINEPQIDFSIPFYKGSLTGLFKTGF